MIVIYLCMISLAKPLKMKKKNGFQKIIIYIYIIYMKFVVKFNIVILESSLSIQSFDNRPVHFHVIHGK